MYVNKCTKCGAEFETKNPKRVICPNCLYPEKKSEAEANSDNRNSESYQGSYNSYSTESLQPREKREDRPYSQSRYDGQRSYNRPYPQQRSSGGQRSSRPYERSEGGYNRDNRGGSHRPSRPYDRNQRPQNNRRPQRPGGRPMQKKPPKQLLVTKEQMLQIEELYKKMLPLPNPDAHEVIGEKIGLEPRKVFFGINLVRQKMMLPKLSYPKRKLAVSPDQLMAIKALYEPLLPLPPIGCHKILAAQLKIDEWRVHVGIGLIRKQMGLDRWNQDREDAPAEFKNQVKKEDAPVEEKAAKKTSKKEKSAAETVETTEEQ